MSSMERYLEALGSGLLHSFNTWKTDAGVPDVAAGVYTVWHKSDTDIDLPEFVYVGYSGRSLTEEKIQQMRVAGATREALWSRLHAHATGRRSGDQFAVYVADRCVLPRMSAAEIEGVAQNTISLDKMVKKYIADHLAFRWKETPDGKTAMAVENEIKLGNWLHGKPFLNPIV
ncbi:MAG: hypothetical protein V3V08_14255 [Nannocystaceae bacterium]